MKPILRNIIHTAQDIFLNVLLPKTCAGCGKANESFCEPCRFASYKNGAQCLICGFRDNTGKICRSHLGVKSDFNQQSIEIGLRRVIWVGNYNGQLKEAIWQLKYKKRKELAKPLGELLYKKFHEIFGSPTYLGSRTSEAKNFVVIPIPLHFKKEYERGFNQAGLLAQEFGKLSNIRCLTNALVKTRETKAQVAVENKEARIKNLDGAFEINQKQFNHLTTQQFNNLTIVLIDDVYTTGATLINASEALAKAGAGDIIGLVVAHGG